MLRIGGTDRDPRDREVCADSSRGGVRAREPVAARLAFKNARRVDFMRVQDPAAEGRQSQLQTIESPG
jgi:hypothetical protein